jgi:hypothetical protein
VMAIGVLVAVLSVALLPAVRLRGPVWHDLRFALTARPASVRVRSPSRVYCRFAQNIHSGAMTSRRSQPGPVRQIEPYSRSRVSLVVH